MKKIEIIITQNPKTKKWNKPQFVEVTSKRARQYVNFIIPRDKNKRLRLREYCENCGRLFGEGFRFQKPVMYKTYFVCPDCKSDLEEELKTGIQKSVPNLNDL